MSYEMNDMSGSLFKNEKKEKETHPNMTGSAVIDGKAYWISAWTKESNGKRWQSLAFKAKDNQKGVSKQADTRADYSSDNLSDIPF